MSKLPHPFTEKVAPTVAPERLLNLQELFLQNVSHELRTPLNALVGFAELLGEGCLGELSEAQTEAVTIIQQAAGRMHRQVDRLTLLLAAEAGELARQTLDMEPLLDDVVADKVQDALAKQIDFRLHVETGLPPLLADRAGLTAAVEALLENAVQFTPAGGHITVQLYQDSGWLWLAVTDDGPGVPAAVQPYLFDRFYQVERRLARQHDGLGLGLTLARAVVEASGGQLQLHSQPDQGTCVLLRLPAVATARRWPPQETGQPRPVAADRPVAAPPIPVWLLDVQSAVPC